MCTNTPFLECVVQRNQGMDEVRDRPREQPNPEEATREAPR
jgi:hypothetical protein